MRNRGVADRAGVSILREIVTTSTLYVSAILLHMLPMSAQCDYNATTAGVIVNL